MEQQGRLEAVVTGRVQGVGFRYHVLDRARALQLVGYVRNRRDGALEVVAEGDRAQLEKLLSYLQVGPHAASVHNVETHWMAASGLFDSFEVRF